MIVDANEGWRAGNLATNFAACAAAGVTLIEQPLPADAEANPIPTLTSVTCPTATACIAVGWYVGASGNAQALIETGSGATWSI